MKNYHLIISFFPDSLKQITRMMTPMDVAERLAINPRIVQQLMTDVANPAEITPAPFDYHLKILEEAAAMIPAHCHGRNHIPLLNKESTRVTRDVIQGVISSTSEIATEIFEEEISGYVGRIVLRSKEVAFGGKVIAQLQIHLKRPVYSQRLRIPIELAGKAILHRRHVAAGATPGMDFFVRMDDTIRPYLKKVQSLVVTVCKSSGNEADIGLGTVYAGTHFPSEVVAETSSEIITPSGHAVFSKWYPNEEARAADAALYAKTAPLATHINVLLDPSDYQTLIMLD